MKFRVTLIAVLISGLFALYGCGDLPPLKVPPKAKQPTQPIALSTPEISLQGTKFADGYVYEQRNRRDPFMTLIVPTRKADRAEEERVGTLEGYALSEFVLAAIAMRGTEYFALLTTPDNRSFTVTKGNIIGLNKGMIEDISKDKIIFVEYSRDYRGDLKPKKITLEFVKGEIR